MNETVKVYGFGSFFTGDAAPQDIDLLLMHRSSEKASCQFAIKCKAAIKLFLPKADIVMLTQSEADALNFLERAKAVALGEISHDNIEIQARTLARMLLGTAVPA